MYTISISGVNNGFRSQIIAGYQKDTVCKQIISDLLKDEDPGVAYHLEDKLLYLKDGDTQRLRIPSSKNEKLWKQILYECHDSAGFGGHFSVAKTLEKVRRFYYWPSLPKFVDAYIKSCDACQRNKSAVGRQAGKLHPLPVPTQRWAEVTMDFAYMPKDSSGNDMCVIFVERLSKRAHLVACQSSLDAKGLAKIFMSAIYVQHGLPKIIYSDRDSLITSKFWQALWISLDTRLRLTTARHQQADGQSERMVKILKDMLRNYVNHHQDNWVEWLPSVEFAYNSTTHSSINLSPFEADLGWIPRAACTPITVESVQCPASVSFTEHLERISGRVQDDIRAALERQKVQYDKSKIHRQFAIGDLVMLNADGITLDARRGLPQSLQSRFIGPFPVTARKGGLVYKLDMSSVRAKIHDEFHVSLLKQYVDAKDGRALPKPPPVIPDTDLYEVESILRKRIHRGKTQYLVRWKGYSIDESTWEPLSSLSDAKDTLRKFNARAKTEVMD